jgi:hypothetical protein
LKTQTKQLFGYLEIGVTVIFVQIERFHSLTRQNSTKFGQDQKVEFINLPKFTPEFH